MVRDGRGYSGADNTDQCDSDTRRGAESWSDKNGAMIIEENTTITVTLNAEEIQCLLHSISFYLNDKDANEREEEYKIVDNMFKELSDYEQ
jgi:hypothetical protein